MYVLQTKVNHPNLWLKIYDKMMWAPIFFMLFSFFTIFIVLNIIVSIFYITYKRHYAKIVFELGTYERATVEDYSRIIAVSKNKDGLIQLSAARKVCKEFLLRGPEYLNYIMAKRLQKVEEDKMETDLLPEGVREVGYNMKHREVFKAIYKTRTYRYFWCILAFYVTFAPVFILEDPRDKWQLTHYNMVEYFSLALLIDPILVLVFMGTKKFKRNTFYRVEIASSVVLVALGVASDFLTPAKGKTLEETNYFFFLVYSTSCMSKVGRLFSTVLKELDQTKAVFAVLSHIGPFLSELVGMLVNIFLIFGQVSHSIQVKFNLV
jgi:hypothetical protein